MAVIKGTKSREGTPKFSLEGPQEGPAEPDAKLDL